MEENIINELDFTYDILIPNQKFLASRLTALDDAQVVKTGETSMENEDVIEAKFDESVSDIDKWDYIVAASSGVLAAAMDILWVKDFSLEDAQSWGKEKTDDFVLEVAQKKGYKGNDLGGAIRKLEDLFKIPADELTNEFGGGKQHHLRDFSHHASLLGLCFSVLGISRSATYCLLNDPRFPKIRIGARYVIPRNEFLLWVDEQLNVAAAS